MEGGGKPSACLHEQMSLGKPREILSDPTKVTNRATPRSFEGSIGPDRVPVRRLIAGNGG